MNKTTARQERESLRQLKLASNTDGFSGASKLGITWRLRLIGRGTSAFFQLGDKAMYIETDAGIGAVSRRSIRYWDDETIATSEEIDAVLDAVRVAFRELGFQETLLD